MLLETVFTSFIAVFVWQHFGRLYKMTYRPSFFLQRFANTCVHCWTVLGDFCYRALQFLKLQELANTVLDLAMPVWEALTSFVYFFKRWIPNMRTIRDFPWDVLGLTTLLFIMFGVLAIVGHDNKSLRN